MNLGEHGHCLDCGHIYCTCDERAELEQERQDDIQEDSTSMEEKLEALSEEESQTWYFTFGSGHEHENCYTVIHGTHAGARKEMVDRYGFKWAFQYDANRWFNDEGISQAQRWNLKEI